MEKGHTFIPSLCPECGLVLLSAEDAARVMGISYPRVRAILNHNPERLSAFKVGGTWIIPEQAAREFRPFPPHRPPKKEKEGDSQ